jgi:hypothetical protein
VQLSYAAYVPDNCLVPCCPKAGLCLQGTNLVVQLPALRLQLAPFAAG